MVEPRVSFYGADLAHVQGAGFGDFTAGVAPGVLAELRAVGIRRGTVVDLGCGAGPWLATLAKAGYDAVGIEVSPALAKLARRAAPKATVRIGSIYDVPIPLCDAITALGEVLGYLPLDGARIPSFGAFFRRVAKSLRPGGVFAFDLIVRHAKRPLHTRNYRLGDDWAVTAETIEDPQKGTLTRDITIFRKNGAGWRRSDELHRVRVPSRQEIATALRDAGFTLKSGRRFGRFELAPHRLAFVARRR